jgi:hypothetical protein
MHPTHYLPAVFPKILAHPTLQPTTASGQIVTTDSLNPPPAPWRDLLCNRSRQAASGRKDTSLDPKDSDLLYPKRPDFRDLRGFLH